MDRTFFTTLAYCYARSKINNTQEEYTSLLHVYEGIKHTITFPTHVIYLDISIDESIKRRASYSKDDRYKYWFDPVFLGHLKEFYTKEFKKFFSATLLYIDTTSLEVEDVVDRINNALCKTTI
jgi:thymidylate kinase